MVGSFSLNTNLKAIVTWRLGRVSCGNLDFGIWHCLLPCKPPTLSLLSFLSFHSDWIWIGRECWGGNLKLVQTHTAHSYSHSFERTIQIQEKTRGLTLDPTFMFSLSHHSDFKRWNRIVVAPPWLSLLIQSGFLLLLSAGKFECTIHFLLCLLIAKTSAVSLVGQKCHSDKISDTL